MMRCSFADVPRLIGSMSYLLLAFSPLAALLAGMVHSWWADQGDFVQLVIPTGRRLALLAKSVGLAAATAVTVSLLGLLAAISLWRWQSGFARHLRWLPAAFVIVPPYIHALAWSALFAAVTGLLRAQSGFLPQGWLISWWVQSMALLPVGVCLSLSGLESIEQTLVEAGQMLGADAAVLARVILPLTAPFTTTAAAFTFLLSFADYSVPSVFGINVYAMEIFAEYSASSDPYQALAIALPALAISLLTVSGLQVCLRTIAQTAKWHSRPWVVRLAWPRWLVSLQQLALLVVLLQMVVLLVSLFAATGAWENFRTAVGSAARDIACTFWVSGAAALVCLPMALAVAGQLLRTNLASRLWWLLIAMPLAVPAPLVGIGLIVVWNRSIQPDIYGSSLMLVLAALARFMPLSVLALLPQLRRIDPLLLDAARVLQRSRLQTAFKIRLPMLAPGFIAAAFITFALTAGELAASLLVAPPGKATLAMRIYNYLHYGAAEMVAGLCLAMAALSLAAAGLSIIAWAGWARLSKEPEGNGR